MRGFFLTLAAFVVAMTGALFVSSIATNATQVAFNDDLIGFDCACATGDVAQDLFSLGMGAAGAAGGGAPGALIMGGAASVIGELVHNGAHGDLNGANNDTGGDGSSDKK